MSCVCDAVCVCVMCWWCVCVWVNAAGVKRDAVALYCSSMIPAALDCIFKDGISE